MKETEYVDSKIGSEIRKMLSPDLAVLDLSNIGFQTIPGFISDFQQLEILNLSGNQIREIDFNILSKNECLYSLDMSGNYVVDCYYDR